MPSEIQPSQKTNSVSISEIEAKNQNKLPGSESSSTKPKTAQHDSRFEKATLNNTNLNTSLFNSSVQHPDMNSKKNEQFTVQKSIDMVRSLVEELRRHGVNADIDEMNFSKSYQIIIKLDKTAE